MRRSHLFTTAAVVVALGLTVVALQAEPRRERGFDYYTFDALPDATATNVQGINARGDIVGSYTRLGVTHGFLFSDGVLTTIDYPGAVSTDARGINARGDVVGTYRIAGEPPVNVHGYLRDKHGVISPLDFPEHTSTIPQRITSTGLILGCRHDTDTMTTMRGIMMSSRDPDAHGEIGAFASMNNGATPDGNLIVGLYTDMDMNRGRGYLLYGDTFIPFDVPGSSQTAAWDVNASGEVVGVYRDAASGVFYGFVWSGLQFERVSVPAATATRAFGVNSRGTVVGTYLDATNKAHGFVAMKGRNSD
jgi:probable HAF family extracellular repeat protein